MVREKHNIRAKKRLNKIKKETRELNRSYLINRIPKMASSAKKREIMRKRFELQKKNLVNLQDFI